MTAMLISAARRLVEAYSCISGRVLDCNEMPSRADVNTCRKVVKDAGGGNRSMGEDTIQRYASLRRSDDLHSIAVSIPYIAT